MKPIFRLHFITWLSPVAAYQLLLALALICSFLTCCTDLEEVEHRSLPPTYMEPKLKSMAFYATANPMELVEDAMCTIVGDSVVECWVRHVMDEKLLVPHFEIEGDAVYADGVELVSGMTKLDFRMPVKLKVRKGRQVKEYVVYVHAFTGLPVLWIETEDRAEIVSKDEYLGAHFRLVEDVVTRMPGGVTELEGYIRGRGETSWNRSPKKSYRLKFERKVALLGQAKGKSWVLLANYFDKTSLRNATAFYMGSISNLDYTPGFHFVDVMLNGRYNGTYLLGEQLKISSNRVDVGDDGFLLEIDSKAQADDVTFRTNHIGRPITIKEPEVMSGDDDYNYVKDFVLAAEEALFANTFTDHDNGWQKYLDMDSFVDWYLINEIAKNNDAVFFTSCYMNLQRGGKLKMGPLWDFDIAFGNVNYNGNYDPEGFWVMGTEWYTRLFQDPAFVGRVRERFGHFYAHQADIMNDINENVKYLQYSVLENNNKWGTLYTYTWPNYDIWGSYRNEVQYMKTWIGRRFEWLKNEFEKFDISQ